MPCCRFGKRYAQDRLSHYRPAAPLTRVKRTAGAIALKKPANPRLLRRCRGDQTCSRQKRFACRLQDARMNAPQKSKAVWFERSSRCISIASPGFRSQARSNCRAPFRRGKPARPPSRCGRRRCRRRWRTRPRRAPPGRSPATDFCFRCRASRASCSAAAATSFSSRRRAPKPATFPLFLIGTVFGILLHQRGEIVLHASAVRVNDKAVLFCGPSGAGKSTLAAALAQRGFPLVTDDLCAITLTAGAAPMVQPDGRHLKLWAQAIEKLDLAERRGAAVRNKLEKFFVEPAAALAEPLPLGARLCAARGAAAAPGPASSVRTSSMPRSSCGAAPIAR